MERIRSQLNVSDEAFRANRTAMVELVDDLRERTNIARAGGAGAERQAKLGKLPVRERIELLLDPGTPFLELGGLAANGMYEDKAPAAGIITGVGMIEGVECLIVANDPSVKGGTYFPVTVKKHLRAQEVALQNHLPCVYQTQLTRLARTHGRCVYVVAG